MSDTTQQVHAALEHWRAGRREQARTLLKRILQRDPAHPGANQLYAIVLGDDGRLDQALYYIGRAIKGDPAFAEFHVTLGLLRTNTADQQGAIDAFTAAVGLDPSHAEARHHLGGMLLDRGRFDEAEESLRAAASMRPGDAGIAATLARLLNESGRSAEAASLLRSHAASPEPDAAVSSMLAFTLNYIDTDPGEVFNAHAAFGRGHPRVPPPRPGSVPHSPEPDRRLRIGIISADLREHAVASFIEPFFRHHDRRTFELVAYHTGGKVDAVSDRLKSLAGTWRHIFPPSDERVRAAVAADRPDILVELGGHTSPRLLGQLAGRLAPVQVTAIGYPNTAGVPSIDARFVDGITDPSGTERWAVERLVRLPGCFLCYQPPTDAPEPRPTTDMVFGSFNNPAKLSPRTIDLWSRVLAAAPGSRLLLKGKSFAERSARERLRAMFPDPSRVECVGEIACFRDHLDLYSKVSVALDPVPYNGTTTTCEALWMGVPVVTLQGDRHAARVGVSLLTAAGRPELIAATPDDYIRLAAGLITDPARIIEYRRTLRSAMAASRLCDGPAYARGFEGAMRELWANWCAGRRP